MPFLLSEVPLCTKTKGEASWTLRAATSSGSSVGLNSQGRGCLQSPRKVDASLRGKGHSKFHGARPVHQIISMISRFGPLGCQSRTLSLACTLRAATSSGCSVGLNSSNLYAAWNRGNSLIRNSHPPYGQHRALGIVLL